MSLPFVNTSISIATPIYATDENDQEYDAFSTVNSGVRAFLSTPKTKQITPSGAEITWSLHCDKAEIHQGDRITDGSTGTKYLVESAEYRSILGYMKCEISRFKDQ